MAELSNDSTLCVLGCGNLGTAILTSLIEAAPSNEAGALAFTRFIACVRSEKSEQRLHARLAQHADKVRITRNTNAQSLHSSSVVILAADPADIAALLSAPGIADALAGKLLISVAAGWTRAQLATALYATPISSSRATIVRTLPNIAALVAHSLTAIEVPDDSPPPPALLDLTDRIFQRVGRTVRVPPRLMAATTAVAGSTPAFFAIVCDALVDASVAVGVPRDVASAMVFQSMAGSAAMLQGGVHPGVLKDRGTSPEGCTIGGVMVLEEGGVRGHLGRALREAVTVARLMGARAHLNDTRQ
ncbi:Pyrroline-5-carboxylate reductase [Botryosphaeria dothidea]|uniref:Pyrroline-5-carboxylate reductase n=1 Tax=Botryosphaeria dothidea TaxID=55169 RepID=A0A8H4IJ22_9PEZI|nr:Pyrroline-5-carboxylate reductase [Botryosphaeria dothidea]